MSLLTLILGLSSAVHATPQQFTHQGRLMDADGIGLSGQHEVHFILMDAEFGGDEYWNQEYGVEFENGYYSVVVGGEEDNPLDSTVFESGNLWLELRLDGDILTPRHPITSAPPRV